MLRAGDQKSKGPLRSAVKRPGPHPKSRTSPSSPISRRSAELALPTPGLVSDGPERGGRLEPHGDAVVSVTLAFWPEATLPNLSWLLQ
jgi:hypothetical protein